MTDDRRRSTLETTFNEKFLGVRKGLAAPTY